MRKEEREGAEQRSREAGGLTAAVAMCRQQSREGAMLWPCLLSLAWADEELREAC